MNTIAIANHLNVAADAIVEVQEWARVLWVRVRGLGARFVSKKVVVMDFTDGNKFDGEFEDKTAWALSILTGEKVENYTKTQSKGNAFLPLVEVFQVGNQTFTYKQVQQAKAQIRWTPPADYQYSNKFTALDLL